MDAPRIESLFPGEVVVEAGDPAAVRGELHPLERELLGRAVEKRRLEIVAGRVLARRALARLGAADHPLLRDEGRAPLWPPGFLGSISHTRGCCAVAVARGGRILGLGLDVEQGRDLPTELLALVCTEAERRWIESRATSERELLGKLFFSAKESVFKCQYPLARRWLGFRDVELRLDLEAARFGARVIAAGAPLWPAGAEFEGRFRLDGDLVASAATLCATEPPSEPG